MPHPKRSEPTRGADSGKAAEPYVPEGHGGTDEQIRADVHELLMKEGGHTETAPSITVENGVVTLVVQGAQSSELDSLIEKIRAVPSVKGVNKRQAAEPNTWKH